MITRSTLVQVLVLLKRDLDSLLHSTKLFEKMTKLLIASQAYFEAALINYSKFLLSWLSSFQFRIFKYHYVAFCVLVFSRSLRFFLQSFQRINWLLRKAITYLLDLIHIVLLYKTRSIFKIALYIVALFAVLHLFIFQYFFNLYLHNCFFHRMLYVIVTFFKNFIWNIFRCCLSRYHLDFVPPWKPPI